MLVLHQADGSLHQVSDDAVHVPPHITHLCELCGFYLDKRCVNKFGQTAGDLGLSDAGGSHHEDILRGNFGAHLLVQLRPAIAIAKGNGYRFLCGILADDVAVQLSDDFFGGQRI